jgi:hypothetical protein
MACAFAEVDKRCRLQDGEEGAKVTFEEQIPDHSHHQVTHALLLGEALPAQGAQAAFNHAHLGGEGPELLEGLVVFSRELAIERRERGQPSVGVMEERGEIELGPRDRAPFPGEPHRGLEDDAEPGLGRGDVRRWEDGSIALAALAEGDELEPAALIAEVELGEVFSGEEEPVEGVALKLTKDAEAEGERGIGREGESTRSGEEGDEGLRGTGGAAEEVVWRWRWGGRVEEAGIGARGWVEAVFGAGGRRGAGGAAEGAAEDAAEEASAVGGKAEGVADAVGGLEVGGGEVHEEG